MGRDDVGSKLSAASGRRSEVSEWPRSKLGASAARQRGNFGHRNSGIVPYGNATRAAVKRGVEDAAPLHEVFIMSDCRGLCSSPPSAISSPQHFPPFSQQKGLTAVFFWHTINILKASQSLPPAGGKLEIIFHRDMCVGKNTSQAAGVEFWCSAPKLCAQQTWGLLAEKTKFFRQL